MNKKLLLGAVLVFGMGATFTSCVDDSESQSVTNIRNAKAEQLKSIAALNSANAEAALILANAEKAAKDAEAAYNQAQAEYQKALAAYQNAQTDAAKQKLAIELEKLQVELQQQQASLQETLAQLEETIAQSRYNALHYRQLYDELLKNAEAAEAQKLQDLIDNYDTASKNLIDAKRTLAKDQMNLIRLQSGLANAKEVLADEISDLEEENAGYQADIEGQEALIATYEKYAGTTVTEEEIQAAHIKYIEAQEAYSKASTVKSEAYDEYRTSNQARNNYSSYVFNNWIYNGNNSLWYGEYNETTNRFDYFDVQIRYVSETTAPSSARGKYCVVIDEQRNNQITYLPLFENYESEENTINYETNNGAQTQTYYTINKYYNLINGGKAIETIIAHKEKQLKQSINVNPEYLASLKEQLPELEKAQADAQVAFDKAVKAYADATTASDEAYAKYRSDREAYVTANTATNEAWNAYYNNTDDTKTEVLLAAAKAASEKSDEARATRDESWNKYVEANTEKNQAYSDKQDALYTLDNTTDALNYTNKMINNQEYAAEQLKNEIDALKAQLVTLNEKGEANEANIKEYNENYKVYAEALVAANVAFSNQTVAWNEYWPIMNGGIIGGNGEANNKIADAKDEIVRLEGLIEANNKSIAEKEAALAKLDTDDAQNNIGEYYEELIKNLQADIEKDQVAVETAQKKFDIAEAELNAAVKSEE